MEADEGFDQRGRWLVVFIEVEGDEAQRSGI